MKKPICLMLLVSFIYSCSESIRFEEPQPKHETALKRIPKDLRGTYFDDDDSTFLYISRSRIIEHEHASFREHKDSLIAEIEKEGYQLKRQGKNEYSLNFEGVSAKMRLEGDTLAGTLTIIDTLFAVSDKNVIKEWDGTYFMSVLHEEERHWRVRSVTLENSLLRVSKMKAGNIDTLKTITPVKERLRANGDVEVYLLNPSPDELKTLLKKRFKVADTYRKIK